MAGAPDSHTALGGQQEAGTVSLVLHLLTPPKLILVGGPGAPAHIQCLEC